jgi:8-oxo-dGTP diphosphatase
VSTTEPDSARATGPAEVPFLDDIDQLSAPSARGRGAMAIVVNPNGIVLHLRDDKPSIPHPGCWSLFGGGVEDGEDPRDAVLRELEEELSLTAVHVRPLWRAVDHGGDMRLLTLFEARTGVAAAQMVLAEGQACREFTAARALGLKLAPFCRRALGRYAAAPVPGSSGGGESGRGNWNAS